MAALHPKSVEWPILNRPQDPMSFRTRLTGFFVVIVVVPMVAVGILAFRLIDTSEQGKADARASGLASAAVSIYESETANGRLDAETIARELRNATGPALQARVQALVSRSGLARVVVQSGTRVVADVGNRSAIAPGRAIESNGLQVTASELLASQYAHDLAGPSVAVIVRQGSRTLSSTLPATAARPLPRQNNVTIDGTGYRAATETFPGFGAAPVAVVVLSDLSATKSSAQTSEVVAIIFIVVFLLLALAFSVLAARALEGQLGRFLEAARRLGSGDFSSPVPTEGRDEFAALAAEFNKMSAQLEHRLEELQQERARLRESIHRIGQTFESNLDRPALLELALRTAVDAVQATCARLTARQTPEEPLAQVGVVGSLQGLEERCHEAEQRAVSDGGLGEAASEGVFVASVALGPIEPGDGVRGLITVARPDREYDDDDRDILRSLAAQATLALENVELHYQVQQQAVTDELTGLANHGRFQELLQAEIEQVRRYRHPVGLIMLDLDDFKSINDTYGHQQGDVVLKQVARVLRDTSREPDTAARYGGEEMAVILPHTDLDGASAISERARSAIAALRIPRLDGAGTLRITASFGVAASADGDKDALIADADAALYTAKRQGKNRTVKAAPRPANVFSAE
jgi:diguanylate cyclase (GGDEF)-like protein